MFLIGILVLHAQFFHDSAACRVADIMGYRYLLISMPFYLLHDNLARLYDDSFAPEFFSQSKTQVMAVIHAHISMADRDIGMLQANSTPIGARLFVFTVISSLKVRILLGLRLLKAFSDACFFIIRRNGLRHFRCYKNNVR